MLFGFLGQPRATPRGEKERGKELAKVRGAAVVTSKGAGKKVSQNQDANFLKAGAGGDPTLLAVLDGHGARGAYIASTAAKALLARISQQVSSSSSAASPPPAATRLSQQEWVDMYEDIDKELEAQVGVDDGGTTACVAVISSDGTVSGSWVGDSRCIVGGVKNNLVWAQPLSSDHSSDNAAEIRRIIRAGGVLQDSSSGTLRVASGSQRTGTRSTARKQPKTQEQRKEDTRTLFRVRGNAGVACTRSLGDYDQRPFCICTPDTFYTSLRQEQVLIMGTDGVWDVLSNEEVVSIVLASQAQGADATEAARQVVAEARDRWLKWRDFSNGYADDVTVAVVLC
eukprot:Tamp_16716.p1 GENE.Tamp_16716~~Tamp_16716.p1  ORF type:complete len:374 (+),score=63.15 Tamp_16716:100-1122(+)